MIAQKGMAVDTFVNEAMAQSDDLVIRRCLEGDIESFAILVDRYQAEIGGQVRWYARTAAAVEELTHEVFVQAYLSLRTFSGRSPFLHWLKKIASRVGYGHLKEQYRQRQNFAVEEWDAAEMPHTGMDSAEAKTLLDGLLDRLEAEDRIVLTMMYLEDLGTREIAERMGWNRAMVKMRVYRAKKKVRAITRREFGPERYRQLLESFA